MSVQILNIYSKNYTILIGFFKKKNSVSDQVNSNPSGTYANEKKLIY